MANRKLIIDEENFRTILIAAMKIGAEAKPSADISFANTKLDMDLAIKESGAAVIPKWATHVAQVHSDNEFGFTRVKLIQYVPLDMVGEKDWDYGQ